MREPYNTRFKIEYKNTKEGHVYATNKDEAFERTHNILEIIYDDYNKKDVELTKDPFKKTK